jgi:hypothetical protein
MISGRFCLKPIHYPHCLIPWKQWLCSFLSPPKNLATKVMFLGSYHSENLALCYPICSMYGIYTYIWGTFGLNAGKYSIHGAYGYGQSQSSING